MSIIIGATADSGLIKLAPDLDYISGSMGAVSKATNVIDTTSGLTTILELSGKFYVSYFSLSNLISENNTIKMTVDNVEVWSGVFVPPASTAILLGSDTTTGSVRPSDTGFVCEKSLVLQMQSITSTTTRLNYVVRPIL